MSYAFGTGCLVTLGLKLKPRVFPCAVTATNGEVPAAEENLPKDGADWVELFVREMMTASDMDDAKARASRVLEVLEKSIYARASSDAAQSFRQVCHLTSG